METMPPSSMSTTMRQPPSNAIPMRIPASDSRTSTSLGPSSYRTAARKRSILTSFPSPSAARAGPTKVRSSSSITALGKVRKPL